MKNVLRFSVDCYAYFTKLLKAINVGKRKIRVFATLSELNREKQCVRRLETSLQAMPLEIVRMNSDK